MRDQMLTQARRWGRVGQQRKRISRSVAGMNDQQARHGQQREQAPGVKLDAGKPPLQLLPEMALEEVAKVLDYGARKYSVDNWRRGMQWRRLIGASLRHIFAFSRGEDLDPETGLSHLAHASCMVLFLLEFQLSGAGTDDRWRTRMGLPGRRSASVPVLQPAMERDAGRVRRGRS